MKYAGFTGKNGRRWATRQERSTLGNGVTGRLNKIHWSVRYGSLAQIATLIVVIVGYIFTVRPVFQYQQLQQESARVLLEKSIAEQQLHELETRAQFEQREAEERLSSLSSALAQEKHAAEAALRTLTISKSRSNKSYSDLRRDLRARSSRARS